MEQVLIIAAIIAFLIASFGFARMKATAKETKELYVELSKIVKERDFGKEALDKVRKEAQDVADAMKGEVKGN
jgi:hypothetical protein